MVCLSLRLLTQCVEGSTACTCTFYGPDEVQITIAMLLPLVAVCTCNVLFTAVCRMAVCGWQSPMLVTAEPFWVGRIPWGFHATVYEGERFCVPCSTASCRVHRRTVERCGCPKITRWGLGQPRCVQGAEMMEAEFPRHKGLTYPENASASKPKVQPGSQSLYRRKLPKEED